MTNDDLFDQLRRTGMPFALSASGNPCFKLDRGASDEKVVVATIPKSGTYLLGEILADLGFVSARIHVSNGGLTDIRFMYRGVDKQIRDGVRNWDIQCEYAAELIRPGQYLLSHLTPDERVKKAYRGFKIIFAYRDLREVVVSAARSRATAPKLAVPEDRMLEEFIRHDGGHFAQTVRNTAAWTNIDACFKVSFKDLTGQSDEDRVETLAREFLDYLNVTERPEPARQAFLRAIGRQTITYSGKWSEVGAFWNDAAEEWFLENKLDEVDDLLRPLGGL